VGYKQKRLR
jgi:hypothetical protein